MSAAPVGTHHGRLVAALLLFLCLPAMLSCQGKPIPISRTRPPLIAEIRLDGALCTDGVTIDVPNDPVYDVPKRYTGMPFDRCLERLGHPVGGLPPDTLVQVVCDDGYSPFVRVADLTRDRAFLASRDAGAPVGDDWMPLPSSATKRDPGPFYLVWPGGQGADELHPWPYGILALRLGIAGDMLGPAAPASARQTAGFELFREHCMKCHAINGVGGTLGVDLNEPYNIFEYWRKEMLPDLIRDPARLRNNSRMPPFRDLSEHKIGLILDYIESMKDRKADAAP